MTDPAATEVAAARPAGAGGRGLSPRAAAALVVLLVLAGFGLRIWCFRYTLPHVFHSDYIQVQQAAQLVREGSFADRTTYPIGHTFVYAGADVVAYGCSRIGLSPLVGSTPWPDWETFARQLQRPEVAHAIGRFYTALAGALLAVAVYLLARLHFARGVAVLAAAVVAIDPVSVICSHQTRIHVPAITLLAFMALPVLRLAARDASARLALRAGMAAGAVAIIIQLGPLLLAAAAGLVVLFVRPWRRAAGRLALLLVGFGAVLGGLWLLAWRSGLVRPSAGTSPMQDVATFGIPFLGQGKTLANFLANIPRFALTWVLVEPVRALAVALFLGLACVRRGETLRQLAVYGTYPLLVLVLLGSSYLVPRYSLSATPFLAVLAAAACLQLPRAWLRAALASLLLLVPLAQSVRYDALLMRPDSRVQLLDALPVLADNGLSVSVEDRLLSHACPPDEQIVRFPKPEVYRAWLTGQTSPRRTLAEARTDVHVCADGARGDGDLSNEQLGQLGYRRWGCIPAQRPGEQFFLPDVPDLLIMDLWTARGLGPPIVLWTRPSGLKVLAQADVQRSLAMFER